MIETPNQKGRKFFSNGRLPAKRCGVHPRLAGKTEIMALSGFRFSPASGASGSGACSSRAREPVLLNPKVPQEAKRIEREEEALNPKWSEGQKD